MMSSRATALALICFAQLRGVLAVRSLALELGGPPEVHGVDNFSVAAKVTNTGDETLKLYQNPGSLLNSFPVESFSVSCPKDDGATVPSFIGARVKYSFKGDTDFVTLNPGESTTVPHDLSAAYKFTTHGTYKVEPSTTFYYYDSDTEAPAPISATLSGTHTAKLDGSLVSTIVAKRHALKRRTNDVGKFSLSKRFNTDCPASITSDLSTTLPYVETYLEGAISYLSGSGANRDRYTTWFGTYSESARVTVLDHYTRIKTSDPATYTYLCCGTGYVCTCPTVTTYAYVYANDPYNIHLCNSFYRADVYGTDSKAGTIIHESSHFTVNGGTKDYAYGQEAAQQLAQQYPGSAIFNADSHEYFAENNPVLS